MSESAIRLSIFFGVLIVMALWEVASPKRQPRYSRKQRWPSNVGIVVVDTLLARLLVPAGLVSVAWYAQSQNLGLLQWVSWPLWLEVTVAVMVLDVTIYWQHRLFHRVPVLWRLHKVHHTDPDFDVTTGLRFHPIEIILSLVIKGAAVVMIGAPAVAVIIFEVILSACSLFNHGNVALPASVERWVRKLLVTQEMHRIHHSTVRQETNSNYGFSVSWWDFIFRSYTHRAGAGSDGLDIGLTQYRDGKQITRLWELLRMPFVRPKS